MATPQKSPAIQALERCAGQVERLQAANDRQKHALDSFMNFLEERDLMYDYNVWASKSRLGKTAE